MRGFLLAVASVLFAATGVVSAQQRSEQNPPESPEIRPGAYAHALFLFHETDFARLPGIPNCCTRFEGGTGLGFDLGGLVEFPMASSLSLRLDAGVEFLSGDLREDESTTVIVGGVARSGVLRHEIDLSHVGATAGIGILWRPIDRLEARGAVTGRIPLSSRFDQREVLVEPEEIGTFENGMRVRNEQSGSLPEVAPFFFGLDIAVGYELPLKSDRSVVAIPELRLRRGIGNLLADSTWRIDDLALGLSIRFGAAPEVQTIDPVPVPPDTMVASVDTIDSSRSITAAVRVAGIDTDGNRVDVPTLRVEEFISTHLRPLLGYVFFDTDSDRIPDRYVSLSSADADRFSVDRLHGVPTMPTYYHLLNILGRRMRDNRGAVLSILGTNDGKEAGGTDLSMRRAQAVRDYLVDTWAIDSSRLVVEARNLPEVPSNRTLAAGDEENRRVELSSETWEILAPVTTVDTLLVSNPPTIEMIVSDDALASADRRLVVTQDGRELRRFDRAVSADSAPNDTLLWRLSEDPGSVPRAESQLLFSYTVSEPDGPSKLVADTLSVDQITVSEKRRERIDDRYIDRYSLILFPFDRADVTGANDSIAAFIERRVVPSAEVRITGHTDWIGPSRHNLRLSLQRAEQTARRLGRDPDAVVGFGETEPLFDGDLPEERFYSRTVRIVVETPVDAIGD